MGFNWKKENVKQVTAKGTEDDGFNKDKGWMQSITSNKNGGTNK